jgi:hypothetical protein
VLNAGFWHKQVGERAPTAAASAGVAHANMFGCNRHRIAHSLEAAVNGALARRVDVV